MSATGCVDNTAEGARRLGEQTEIAIATSGVDLSMSSHSMFLPGGAMVVPPEAGWSEVMSERSRS